MTSLEHVQALMEELGPATPEIEAVAQRGDTAWAVALPDDLVVVAEIDATERKLVLTVDVGRPSDEVKLAAYELALTYAYLWRDTGGARLALGGVEGDLALLYDVEIADLTLPKFQSTLFNIAEKARIWRRYFAGVEQSPTAEVVGVRI